jgi:hypothetical protein
VTTAKIAAVAVAAGVALYLVHRLTTAPDATAAPVPGGGFTIVPPRLLPAVIVSHTGTFAQFITRRGRA